jgi:hypothetical protein
VPSDSCSTLDLQKMAKNISVMVGKIADLSCMQESGGQREGKQAPNVPFRLSNFKEISVIRQSEEVQAMVQQAHSQESYGLETIRPKQSRARKVHKLGLRSIDRLGCDEMRLPPATPSPRHVHRWDYAEGDERREKSRSSKAGPLSPCNHSSSMSQKGKSRSKNRSSRRR